MGSPRPTKPRGGDIINDDIGECPICYSSFRTAVLEDHVNVCLDKHAPNPHQTTLQNVEKDDKVLAAETAETSRKRPRLNFPTDVNAGNSKQQVDQPATDVKVSESDSDGPLGLRLCPIVTNEKPSFRSYFTQSPKFSRPNANTASADRSSAANNNHEPLAETMRPKTLADFVGQDNILSEGSLLRTLIADNAISSMILWGPPGCGKTSLANVIAIQCRQKNNSKFVKLSATNSGVNEVKEAIKIAKNDLALQKKKTILFIDEIHRFNKLQQDTFLPYVENGTITLIGATTENPSFSLNSALLSRCRVFVMEKLSVINIEDILQMTIKHLHIMLVETTSTPMEYSKPSIERDALSLLANLSDGDARIALNCLHMAIKAQNCKYAPEPSSQAMPVPGEIGKQYNQPTGFLITGKDIKESLQRTHLLYDKKGDEHYNCISALHKSMRGHDADASLYWLGRMLQGGEDPLYVARRLIRFASEDIGIADPSALNQAVTAYQACQFIGMPECDVILAQCVVYLASAPKSVKVYSAYMKVKDCIRTHVGPLPGVPLHLRNAPTKLMKDIGCGKGYKYNPSYQQPVEQDYMPDGLKHVKFLNAD